MTKVDYDELVDRVAGATKGTAGDPLTRDEVEQVVAATLVELAGVPELGVTLPERAHERGGRGYAAGMETPAPQDPTPDEQPAEPGDPGEAPQPGESPQPGDPEPQPAE